MPGHSTMSEHAMRYAWACGVVGGLDVLDLGCGTGYGSEMHSWTARRVRGFDLWQPDPDAVPNWPSAPELHFSHDLCHDPLPDADAGVMFEVLEHLPDPLAALERIWSAVSLLVLSFPNPTYHGSHLNPWHVNDWPLGRVETHLEATSIEHFHQPHGSPSLSSGRDPEAPFWVMIARR
jgi:2-polyprenyl-3-methyl-5-hydroxy-6-metoxy-1,4-benzoquinol methylase